MKIPLLVEIIGDPATGKTHASLQFPNPFLIDTTPKMEALPIVMKLHKDWRERYVNVRDWKMLERAVDSALQREFKTIVFDTSVDLQRLAAEEWCRQHGKERVYPITLYGQVRQLVDNVINKIVSYGRNIVFTSQLRDEYIDGQKTGRKERDGYKKLPYFCDIELLVKLEKEGDKVVRKWRVLKNRFVDRTSPEWVDGWEGDLTWERIVELTKLPREVLVE